MYSLGLAPAAETRKTIRDADAEGNGNRYRYRLAKPAYMPFLPYDADIDLKKKMFKNRYLYVIEISEFDLANIFAEKGS